MESKESSQMQASEQEPEEGYILTGDRRILREEIPLGHSLPEPDFGDATDSRPGVETPRRRQWRQRRE